ncbi:hypothetical protein AC579_2825 [Pseudocercospora musae]|uniref:Uncharacterized protein n=1 Tax=Pseudocercospora musae TaxID=113226 RepID=A0A139IKT8_9PEZI|nr:hypothetical protein AC579_2825 [Pseudocercospora musae]
MSLKGAAAVDDGVVAVAMGQDSSRPSPSAAGDISAYVLCAMDHQERDATFSGRNMSMFGWRDSDLKGRCFGNVETILDASECPAKHVHRRTGVDFSETQSYAAADDQSASSTTMLSELFALDRDLGRTPPCTSLFEETIKQSIAMLPDGLPYDRDRRLCTVVGIMGRRPAWKPPQAMSGDKVCQFSGAPFPFIVRDNPDGSCALVGDSYVQGVHGPELSGADMPTPIATVADSHTSEAAMHSWLPSEDRTMLVFGSVVYQSACQGDRGGTIIGGF